MSEASFWDKIKEKTNEAPQPKKAKRDAFTNIMNEMKSATHHGGSIYGDPDPGHRVDTISAAILVLPDGTEGTFSAYGFDLGGQAVARIPFIASNPKIVEVMKEMTDQLETELEDGAHIEWREYKLSDQ